MFVTSSITANWAADINSELVERYFCAPVVIEDVGAQFAVASGMRGQDSGSIRSM